MKDDKSYEVVSWRAVQPLLRVRWIALLIHWTFQGLLYMDRTERAFKLGTEAALAIVLGALIQRFVGLYWAVGLAVVVAHTINFAFNSHPYVVLKNFGQTRYDESAVLRYALVIQQRIKRERSVLCAGIWGGFAREQQAYANTPDLDMRIVRRPGFVNGVRACWFALRERTQANLNGFPLDLYVLDDVRQLSKLRRDEVPFVVHDPDERLAALYPAADRLPPEGLS